MSPKVFSIPSSYPGILGSSSAQRGQSFFLAKRELKNHAWPQADARVLTAWFPLLPSSTAETSAALWSVSWSTETKTSLLVWILLPWVSSSSRVAQGWTYKVRVLQFTWKTLSLCFKFSSWITKGFHDQPHCNFHLHLGLTVSLGGRPGSPSLLEPSLLALSSVSGSSVGPNQFRSRMRLHWTSKKK